VCFTKGTKGSNAASAALSKGFRDISATFKPAPYCVLAKKMTAHPRRPQQSCHPTILFRLLFAALASTVAPFGDADPRPQSHFYSLHAPVWHRFAYPSLYLNICGRNPWSPIATDGSVLVRRVEDASPRITAFCKAHSLSVFDCLAMRKKIAEIKANFPDEYNWIVSPVQYDGHWTFEVRHPMF
jgi:hypothetical protein